MGILNEPLWGTAQWHEKIDIILGRFGKTLTDKYGFKTFFKGMSPLLIGLP